MEAPDFRGTENPDERVARLVSILKQAKGPTILAGSSMGGYVAAAAARNAHVPGLFLLAPAFYLPGHEVHVFSGLPKMITVVHGWNDDVVPVEHSIRFSKGHRAALHIFHDNHRLQESHKTLCLLFDTFLKKVMK